MSNNGIDEFIAACKNLTKTINDKREILSDVIRQNEQSKKTRRVETNENKAFAENIEYAKGSMISCYCTVCGNKIQLHEKLSSGFCEYCGEKVDLKESLEGEFELDECAIDNMDGESLFELAMYKGNSGFELMEISADKGCLNAIRWLAGYYSSYYNYSSYYSYVEKALPYAVAGVAEGDKDCILFEIAVKIKLGKLSSNSWWDALGIVENLNKKEFITSYAKQLYDDILKTLKKGPPKDFEQNSGYSNTSISSVQSSTSYFPTFDGSSSDRVAYNKMHDELDEIRKITNRVNIPGYDTESSKWIIDPENPSNIPDPDFFIPTDL